jgi:hypothetical protein
VGPVGNCPFLFKYNIKLGTCPISRFPFLPLKKPINFQLTKAIKIKTFFQANVGGKKLQRVALSVNLHGIKVVDLGTEDTHLEVSIYR